MDEIKETMREVMLSIMQCEDDLLASFTSKEQRDTIVKRFEELREKVMMIYVRSLRRNRQGFLYEYLPSIFKPKISSYNDKVKRWVEHLDSLLDKYGEVIKRLKEERKTKTGEPIAIPR